MDKITAQVADNAKNQFDKSIEAASLEHKESFLKFNFTEDCLDTFFGLYLANQIHSKDLRHICKIKFILPHGQSSVERGFSFNKEVLLDNLQEKSLILQRLVYDTLQSNNTKPQDFMSLKIYVEVACYRIRCTSWSCKRQLKKKLKALEN